MEEVEEEKEEKNVAEGAEMKEPVVAKGREGGGGEGRREGFGKGGGTKKRKELSRV